MSRAQPLSLINQALMGLMLVLCSQSCLQGQSDTSTQVVEAQSPKLFADSLSEAALLLTEDEVHYDPSYYSIDYPGGDVPAEVGVCTDVVIRAYRQLDIDLQVLVHEDMSAHFDLYPKSWGLKSPDSNIDHRRVPNLMVFFSQFGEELELSTEASDYLPGDIVCWDLGNGITHIGIVVNRFNDDGVPMVVHNIGAGQVLQDCLFDYTQIGHYRFED